MAESARKVKHYVSDCLSERHPYDKQKGFAGSHYRDKGRIFDGFLPGGIENLVNSLTDETVGDEERAKAVHHLYAHSLSQEMKMTLLEMNIVSLIIQILRRQPFVLLEHQCFLLLRSLCTIPQGCYPVTEGGGVEAALVCILDERSKEERESARTAAVHMLYQMAFNFAGIRWMLQVEDCEEFKLQSAKVDLSPFVMRIEDIIRGIMFVLDRESLSKKVGLHAVSALAQLTAIAPVVHLCVDRKTPLDTVTKRVDEVTQYSEWSGISGLSLCQLLISVHNFAMDQKCVEALEERGIPDILFRLFSRVRAGNEDVLPFSTQRHLLGALSAVHKLKTTKLKALDPIEACESRIEELVHYLEYINEIVETFRQSSKEIPNDIIAISKNTVQCIRISSEIRPVRDWMMKYITEMEKSDETKCFFFRRQLYYSTPWEEMFGASI